MARETGPIERNFTLLALLAGELAWTVRDALTWILHTEEVYKKTREILPTDATIFLTCTGALIRLYSGVGWERLREIFGSDSSLGNSELP
jgi:hypothetical protein